MNENGPSRDQNMQHISVAVWEVLRAYGVIGDDSNPDASRHVLGFTTRHQQVEESHCVEDRTDELRKQFVQLA